MAEDFTLNIEPRADLGKGASRRLRRLEQKVPAVIYGAGQEPASISVLLRELVKQLESEAFYSHVLTLKEGETETKVVLKDLQRHPAKGFPMHADFLRIDETHKITMHIPLHFINESKCAGVKAGGTIAHQLTDVVVSCLPQNLPEFIEVDMSEVNVGESLHLSDLKVPEGVQLVEISHGDSHDHDLTVVNVNAAKGGGSDAEAETEEGAT